MSVRSVLHSWFVINIYCTITAVLVYAMMPAESGSLFQQIITGFLYPGTVLYVLLNGSLLFGGGFGKFGDFLVIGMSSALTWSLVILFAVRVIPWLFQRRTRRH